MRKNLLLLSGLFFIAFIHAQVGINTESPLGLLHIDAGIAGVTSDDVIILNDGKVGIGTTTPFNKLSIVATGANTGVHLPNGAASGRVLTSDTQGNGVWISGAVQYQTSVYGIGNQLQINGAVFPNFVKLTSLRGVLFDRAKDIYGAAYGWDANNQQYVAPVSGVYRIAYGVYFQTRGNIGENFRAYIFRNGSQFINGGLVSVTDAGYDIASSVMGLANLAKGDVIDLRVSCQPSGTLAYWAGVGHTFLIIESL